MELQRSGGDVNFDQAVFDDDDPASFDLDDKDEELGRYARKGRETSFGSASADDDDEDHKRRGSLLGSSWKGTRNLFRPKNLLARTSSIESNSDKGSTSLDLVRTLSNLARRTSNEPTAQPSDRTSKLLSGLSPSVSGEPLGRRKSATVDSHSADEFGSPHQADRQRRYSATVLDLPDKNNLPRSPMGARMLNGKIYGVAGMNLAKKVDAEARKGPEFVEWGGRSLMGSNSYNREDEDDGSGEISPVPRWVYAPCF